MYTYGDASNKIGTISKTWFGREKGELEVFDLCFWMSVLAAECLLGQLLCEMCLTRDDDNNADCTSLPTLRLENAEKRFCCTWPKDENSSAFDTCKQKKNCGNS